MSFVVDEVTGEGMEGVHFLEIRGVAELTVGQHDLQGHLDREIIRIHPRRVVSFNVDPPDGFGGRDLADDEVGATGPAVA